MPENQTLNGNKSHPITCPQNKWLPVDFQEIWEYRERLYSFVSRDVKNRNQQTGLEFIRAIIQLLFMMIIFTLFFGRFAKILSEGVPDPLFSFAALLPWTLFYEGPNRSTTSRVCNGDTRSDDIAIRVKGLGKKLAIGEPQENYSTLRDAIVNSVQAPFNRASPSEEFLSAQRML